MKQKIIEFAKSIEIEMIGFSKYYYDNDLKRRHDEKYTLHYDIPLNYRPEEVVDLTKILPDVNTIITIALPYYKECKYLDSLGPCSGFHWSGTSFPIHHITTLGLLRY